MKMKIKILAILLSLSLAVQSLAGFNTVPGFKLQLDEESLFTDKTGILIPDQIIKTPIGRLVKIYRTDGFCYSGRVTSIEEGDGFYKIYGSINNVENAQFGFALIKGGIFAGAIIERKDPKIYSVEFSESHKGFILLRNYKYEIPSI